MLHMQIIIFEIDHNNIYLHSQKYFSCNINRREFIAKEIPPKQRRSFGRGSSDA